CGPASEDVDEAVEFVVGVVKVRRNPYVSGAAVDDDAVIGESPDCAGRVIMWYHDQRGTGAGVGRSAEREASVIEPDEQVFGEVAVAFTYGNDADLVDDVLRAQCAVDGGKCRCAELEAARILLEFEAMDVEVELST